MVRSRVAAAHAEWGSHVQFGGRHRSATNGEKVMGRGWEPRITRKIYLERFEVTFTEMKNTKKGALFKFFGQERENTDLKFPF